MRFKVTGRFERPALVGSEPLIVLRRDGWDDWGYKTLFNAELHRPGAEAVELGLVKILKRGQVGGQTPFAATGFQALDQSYCSLGQDIEYYEHVARQLGPLSTGFLRAIRDAATDPSIARDFEREEGWTTSLLRFGQAEHTLATAASLFGAPSPMVGVATLEHSGMVLEHALTVKFDDSGRLPGRVKALIGYNGVGKTRLLADIARDISRVGSSSSARRRQGTFGAVVAVSYSAFDTFELPPHVSANDESLTTHFGYTYCGLRTLQDGVASVDLKSIAQLDAELVEAWGKARGRDNTHALREALAVLEDDPSFGRAGFELSSWLDRDLISSEIAMSSGQKMVLNVVVQLAAQLRNRSLVLLDEPETHLHPSLLSATIRAVQSLLEEFDSFAILATHSPVVLQEVPARDVLVLERFGPSVRASSPEVETFGSTLGELVKQAFSLDTSVADYRRVLRDLAREIDVVQLDELFPLGLSTQARALFMLAQAAE